MVSTVAGTGEPGFADGRAAEVRFSNNVMAICVDNAGNLYVDDVGNRRIRKVTPDRTVSTLFEFTDPDQTPINTTLAS
jgi:hypothetical protein